MPHSRKRFIAATVLAAICLPTTLFGVIVEEREYHGKKVLCAYSGLIGVAKTCGTRYHARVFTGMVKSAVEVGETDKLLEILPEEVFLGDGNEIKAITNQACLGTEISAGDKWLFYLDRDEKSGQLVLSYGGPSKPLASAANEASMLRRQTQLTENGLLTGRVRLVNGGQNGRNIPLADHEIDAVNVEKDQRFTTYTDQDGYFVFELPVGTYQLSAASRDGLQEIENQGSLIGRIPVEKGGCWQHDFGVRAKPQQ